MGKLEAQVGNRVAILDLSNYPGLSKAEAKARHLEEHPEDAYAGIWIIVRDLTD